MIFTSGLFDFVGGHGVRGLALRGMEAERHRAVGTHEIRDEVGQRNLREVEMLPEEKPVTLVDQVEDRADD
jgi:hypothetical protein